MLSRFAPFLITSLLSARALAADETWLIDQATKIGGHAVAVIGNPSVIEVGSAKALVFDGVDDGVVISAQPLAGAKHFTIQVLFRPDQNGPENQKILQVQEGDTNRRLLFETHLDKKGRWGLDTFVSTENETFKEPLTFARKRSRPLGEWYWLALRYDGKVLTQFVNGANELEREIRLVPLSAGQVSLGMRINKTQWFKGAIREVRFHAEALPPEQLARSESK